MHQNLSLYLTLLLHAVVFSLLYSASLCEYATIYLLLMGLWEVFAIIIELYHEQFCMSSGEYISISVEYLREEL